MDQYYSNQIKYLSNLSKDHENKIKISLIGCGKIGGTCIAALLYSKISANIVLIEPIEENFGIEKNLYESLNYCDKTFKITCSNEITASKDSDICLICFEYVKRNKLNNNENIILENISNFHKFIPQVVKYSPKVILIVLTYPFFVLTQICYRIAKIPKNRIIGLGTSLATSELKIILAKQFDVSLKDICCYVIGLSSYGYRIPVWSSATICGVNLCSLLSLSEIEQDLPQLCNEFEAAEMIHENLIQIRGPPRWTIALLCSRICNAILNDTEEVFVLTANIKGLYDIKYECCVSVPCSIGRTGIHSILYLNLNSKENIKLKRAAKKSYLFLEYLLKKYTDDNELLAYFDEDEC